MAIPKIIHYCWLSGEPFPEDIQKCIDSWKKYMPDYQFKLWDKQAFDCDSLPYTKQALEKKKYAFVSDYIRLYALYTEGGIYLDSDIEVFKSFDELLDNKAFTGMESGRRIGAWLFASEKGNPLFKKLLEYYETRNFLNEKGEMDLTLNEVPTTKIFIEEGLQAENKLQYLENITVYPEEYFCPLNPWTGETKITENTYAMHLFKGAWNQGKSEDVSFVSGINRYISRFKEWMEKEKRNKVIVYGLGVVGTNALEQLAQQCPDINVEYIFVTKYDNAWDKFDGIPIIEVHNSEFVDKECVVLIATAPKSHDAIKATLAEYGYRNVVMIGK